MSCCASCGAKTKGALIMAIFHMTAKVCKTSATAKIDYIQRQNKYSYSTKAEDLIFFVRKKIFLLGQKMHETFLLNWINKNYPKKKKSVLTSLVKIEM